ncbi:MAG: hypothetical protein R3C68_06595 [Myxococcota bacterium]
MALPIDTACITASRQHPQPRTAAKALPAPADVRRRLAPTVTTDSSAAMRIVSAPKAELISAMVAPPANSSGVTLTATNSQSTNPLLAPFTGYLGTPPFEQLSEEHFYPAYMAGIAQQKQEIEQIVNNPAPPTFDNAIEALERSGAILKRTDSIFSQLYGATKSERLIEIAAKVEQPQTEHNSSIMLNRPLFQRVETVFNQRDQLPLTAEQRRLLEVTYRDFVRSGAKLSSADQAKLRELDLAMATPSREFADNVTKASAESKLVVSSESELTGLPADLLKAAATKAEEAGKPGQWIFTADQATHDAFLTFADNRQLRQQMYENYVVRGIQDGPFDNRGNITTLLKARQAEAKLKGYASYAHYFRKERRQDPDQGQRAPHGSVATRFEQSQSRTRVYKKPLRRTGRLSN